MFAQATTEHTILLLYIVVYTVPLKQMTREVLDIFFWSKMTKILDSR